MYANDAIIARCKFNIARQFHQAAESKKICK